MNAYIYRKDVQSAADFLKIAATKPKAPDWYKAAAVGFLDKKGRSQTALRYLDQLLEDETNPAVRESLQKKRLVVIHGIFVAQIGAKRTAFADQQGLDVEDVRDLSVLGTLPPDPMEGVWVVSVDGDIISSTLDEQNGLRAQRVERKMLTRDYSEFK
jgi:hypothetical protein